LPHVVSLSRAIVIQVTQKSETAVDVDLRLVTDPTPEHPVGRATDEHLSLQIAAGGRLAIVEKVAASDPHDLAPGPHAVGVDTRSGLVTIRFDSDLDARSIAAAVSVRGNDGSTVAALVSYEASTRTVVIRLPANSRGRVTVTIGGGQRDIAGQSMTAPFSTVVIPSG
jgi:Bacterial Ig-like domain